MKKKISKNNKTSKLCWNTCCLGQYGQYMHIIPSHHMMKTQPNITYNPIEKQQNINNNSIHSPEHMYCHMCYQLTVKQHPIFQCNNIHVWFTVGFSMQQKPLTDCAWIICSGHGIRHYDNKTIWIAWLTTKDLTWLIINIPRRTNTISKTWWND